MHVSSPQSHPQQMDVSLLKMKELGEYLRKEQRKGNLKRVKLVGGEKGYTKKTVLSRIQEEGERERGEREERRKKEEKLEKERERLKRRASSFLGKKTGWDASFLSEREVEDCHSSLDEMEAWVDVDCVARKSFSSHFVSLSEKRAEKERRKGSKEEEMGELWSEEERRKGDSSCIRRVKTEEIEMRGGRHLVACIPCLGWKEVDVLFLSNSWWEDTSFSRFDFLLPEVIHERRGKTKNTSFPLDSLLPLFDWRLPSSPTSEMVDRCSDVSFIDNTKEKLVCLCDDLYWEKKLKEFVFSSPSPLQTGPALEDIVGKERLDSCSEEQIHALSTFLTRKVTLLDAPGGTGKTDYVLRNVIRICFSKGWKVLCTCLSHFVRRNLSSILDQEKEEERRRRKEERREEGEEEDLFMFGEEEDGEGDCFTTASILCKLDTQGGESSLVGFHVLLVDETSMIGSVHLSRIVVSLPWTRVLLMGDCSQLPPISPGNPFSDLCLFAKGSFRQERNKSYVTLTRVFRSGETLSRFCDIYRETPLNFFKLPIDSSFFSSSVFLFFCREDDPSDDPFLQFESALLHLRSGLLEKDDSSVLCLALSNDQCRKAHKLFRKVWRGVDSDRLYVSGDRAVFSKNTLFYKNGDSCSVVSEEKGLVTVRYSPSYEEEESFSLLSPSSRLSPLRVSSSDWTVSVPDFHLIPGYCVTAHKAQGSQRKNVLLLSHPGRHPGMLWIYSSVSRSKSRLFLTGSRWFFSSKDSRKNLDRRSTVLSNLLSLPTTQVS